MTTSSLIRRGFLIVSVAGLLAGCAAIDPFERDGVWNPTGAERENIAVQAANPSDLLIGHGDATSPGPVASGAIGRIYSTDKGQEQSASSGGSSSGGGASGGGGAGGGGSSGGSGY